MRCSIPTCERDVHARTWCKKHYIRWRATGNPLAMKRGGPKTRPEAERFWEKVVKTETCWLWTGAKASKYGHGKFMSQRKNTKAHRWAYEALVGPIPVGLTIDHLCRVPACVNPAHLEPVTLAENLRRQGAAQTHCKNGHPLSGDNVYTHGGRHCRICRNEASRRYRKRRRTGASTAQL